MIRILIVFIFLSFVWSEQSVAQPLRPFDKALHRYGAIAEGVVVKLERFSMTGKATIHITKWYKGKTNDTITIEWRWESGRMSRYMKRIGSRYLLFLANDTTVSQYDDNDIAYMEIRKFLSEEFIARDYLRYKKFLHKEMKGKGYIEAIPRALLCSQISYPRISSMGDGGYDCGTDSTDMPIPELTVITEYTEGWRLVPYKVTPMKMLLEYIYKKMDE